MFFFFRYSIFVIKVLDGFEVLMKVVNSVNFFPTLEDCFTGEDITPDDFRLPFGITNV